MTYDRDWYIGKVESVCEDKGDLSIRFMHPKGSGWRYQKKSSGLQEMTFVLSLKITSCAKYRRQHKSQIGNIRFFQTTLKQSLALYHNIVLK